MNAEDSLRNRRRANIRRLLVDKVICPAGGEPFGAVVEACWVCGVHHLGIQYRNRRRGSAGGFSNLLINK
jgi:hypothetical protein